MWCTPPGYTLGNNRILPGNSVASNDSPTATTSETKNNCKNNNSAVQQHKLILNVMAQFSHIGKHCAAAGCNRQDFLPFSCDSCGHNFCLEHRTYKSHSCVAGCKKQLGRVVMTCPLCHENIAAKPHQTDDEAMSLHVQHSCIKGDEGREVRQKLKAARKRNRCQHKGCKTKLHGYDSFDCSSCGRHFCVSHRMKDDHKCKKYTRRLHARACGARACGVIHRAASSHSLDSRPAYVVL